MNGILERRAAIIRSMRAFLDARDFIEVETAVRLEAPAPEEHIDCPPVATGGYLRASPELQMKKLLAQGLSKIYQIGPCFREGEKGSRHNPEFTMIEWYRKDADYTAIQDDTKALLCQLGLPAAFQTLKVREAYQRLAGWDPWVQWDADRFDVDMATKVEPALKKMGQGVFLVDYPVQAASLARIRGDVAERWELYWDGMELANCFTELCDASEQRARFEKAKAARQALGESDYPLDCQFFDCLPFIKSAAGVAMGVDRLIMVLTGMKEISAVRAQI